MWPLSDYNRKLLLQHVSELGSFVSLCGQFEGPLLNLIDSSTALFMQAGVIHATITLEGGILIGINTFSAGSALASLQCFLYELEAQLEENYAEIFRLFTLQLKAISGDLSISREFLRQWLSLSDRLNDIVRRRVSRDRLKVREKLELQNLLRALLAVAEQEGVLPGSCCNEMDGISHFQKTHLLVAGLNMREIANVRVGS
ncbi:uncharacterized protein Z519_12734 [Cladophialophora bantiana CBS 173.52]|uniref:Uncharacterized protein n=1 Tax=Cladophialophora bantiana (strain ATCC 10958 / CBS 173.52 / CDC B-1940 / NIH 8579) TaxID=1442370 RepID=A0A0D2HQF2_CLAB1|nr:uncharacterized protein Z519_12734 [Cladophialophora bantiana CBS 173.52]KIW86679.1 hypothetical protein Z519_12734 [Cladophialophora bantiana CBS 173.52]